MSNWKDEQLNDLYQREQLNRAQQARDVRAVQEQDNRNEFWSLFTRKQSR